MWLITALPSWYLGAAAHPMSSGVLSIIPFIGVVALLAGVVAAAAARSRWLLLFVCSPVQRVLCRHRRLNARTGSRQRISHPVPRLLRDPSIVERLPDIPSQTIALRGVRARAFLCKLRIHCGDRRRDGFCRRLDLTGCLSNSRTCHFTIQRRDPLEGPGWAPGVVP